MDVLQTSKNLIQKITNMIITEFLSLEQFVEVGFHEPLHYVSVILTVKGKKYIKLLQERFKRALT